MSFLEVLKIEFLKVKRGKMIPLIFVAPLLVVVSGVANLQSYFSPEYTNAYPTRWGWQLTSMPPEPTGSTETA